MTTKGSPINPIVSSQVFATKTILEENLKPEHISGALVDDENEYYRVYNNGVVVKLNRTNHKF
jgi:hypothetical protein